MKSFGYLMIKCGLFFCCFCSAAAADTQNSVFSIRLKQAPVVQTLQQLALQQNIDLILDDELQGTVSLQLDNTDFDRLIRAIARIKSLTLEQENGIYYLRNPSKNEHFAQPMNNSSSEISVNPTALQPDIVTVSIKLQFAKASEVMKSLTMGSGSLLSAQGNISFDDRSNLLIIQDEPQSIRQIKKLVAEMDKPIEQIAIEARIVTISDESLKELGVRWGIFNPTAASHRISGTLEGNGFDVTNQLNVNFPAGPSAASIALQVARINGRLLDLELTALERENNVEIIASPRLLTTNKKSASIKQGTEIPYVINNTKKETQSVEFREAVLGLEVTPHISKDNSILLDLLVSQNSPSNVINTASNQFTTIDKQEINTQVSAKDGETIVLGGVFHDTVSKREDKVPLLGDIPLIKHAFRSESEKHQKRELVIFVTPHILKQGQTLEE